MPGARRHRRPSGVGALVLLVACGTVPVAGASGAAGASAPSAGIRWRACDDAPEQSCGRLSVPLDRASPRGRRIDLALRRIRAARPASRIGTLLVNPGGPGASGVDAARDIHARLPGAIRNAFDIVGWDPRGTGRSAPVRCGSDLDYLFAPDTAPDSAAERRELERAADRFAGECARRSGDLLAHVSSFDTVRDMEAIRAALGERRLNFLGYSYGTYLGALYAARYPRHVRAMVLDGAVDPSLPQDRLLIEQAQGFDAGLARFLSWCDGQRSCAFSGVDEGGAAARFERIRADVDAHPRSVDGRRFGPTQLDLAVGAALYSGRDAYPLLAESLAALDEGRPRPLLELNDFYVGRIGAGRYDRSWGAFLAVSCLDGPSLGGPAALAALAERARLEAPAFGPASVGLGQPCATWRTPPVLQGPVSVHAPDAPPIVVIGTRGDPATPLRWAEGLAAQLGTARLVVAPGAQHTSYPSGDTCLDPLVERYLRTGRIARGRDCTEARIRALGVPPVI